MDGNIDKVREALENARAIAAYIEQASDDEGLGVTQDAKQIRDIITDSLAALSTIDPESIKRECAYKAKQAILSAPYDNPTRAYAAALAEAAIFSAEPAHGGKDGCARCRNRPLPGASRALCESCKLVIGKNYDPRPVSSGPAQDDGKAEVGDVVAWVNSGGDIRVGQFGIEITQGDAVVIRRRAEVKRRIEEAKE